MKQYKICDKKYKGYSCQNYITVACAWYNLLSIE